VIEIRNSVLWHWNPSKELFGHGNVGVEMANSKRLGFKENRDPVSQKAEKTASLLCGP
jgi:hypothetical protein